MNLIHLLLGISLVILPLIIIKGLRKKASWVKPTALITAIISWVLLWPAGNTYLFTYPARKAIIKAGSFPWIHLILMETKEHWGILLPLIVTVAAGLIYSGKAKESVRWWKLTFMLSILMGVLGMIVFAGSRM